MPGAATTTHRTGPRPDLTALVILLVAVNLATALVLDGWASATVLVGAAVLAVVVARRRGYSGTDLGLAPRDAPSGLRWGAGTSALVVGTIVLAAVLPATGSAFRDDRFVGLSGGEVAGEVLVRIPLVTALSEELLFRSVLLAVLLAMASTRRAVLGSSLLFGLWHVGTTVGDLGGNDATDDLSVGAATLAVAGVVVVTGLAGTAFCWLRLKSGSVVAPWLVHWAINACTFLAGVVVAD